MSIAQKMPKIAPWSMQKCPFCGELKMIVASGMIRTSMTEVPTLLVSDRGYSFCNCKSVWFTNWDNIDLRQRHNNESVEQLRFLLYEGKIKNEGLRKNQVLVLGEASLTEKEFKRLGFKIGKVVDYGRTGEFGGFNLIWAYHIFEHMREPLQSLKEYHTLLVEGGKLFVAMPDPFFIEFEDLYTWEYWLLREHYVMWDMDSFCDEAETVGFKVIMKERNTKNRPCKDMHIVLQK